jgi:hypothetical protein
LFAFSTLVTADDPIRIERVPRGILDGFDNLPTIAPLFVKVRTTSEPGRIQSVFLGMVNRFGNFISSTANNLTNSNSTQGGFFSRMFSNIFRNRNSTISSQNPEVKMEPHKIHEESTEQVPEVANQDLDKTEVATKANEEGYDLAQQVS